jgi:hypothetical protein
LSASGSLRIRPVARADAAALLCFELEHRAFFERWINARDPKFYSEPGVAAAIASAETAICEPALPESAPRRRAESTTWPPRSVNWTALFNRFACHFRDARS